jgi:hypothetical protein
MEAAGIDGAEMMQRRRNGIVRNRWRWWLYRSTRTVARVYLVPLPILAPRRARACQRGHDGGQACGDPATGMVLPSLRILAAAIRAGVVDVYPLPEFSRPVCDHGGRKPLVH